MRHNKKWMALALVLVALLAVFVTACGSDESREDANDVTNGHVDKSAPFVIDFNNHYPNVETKCDGFGHRLFVMTHDSAEGRNLLVLPDPTCTGPGTSMQEILETNEQPASKVPQTIYDVVRELGKEPPEIPSTSIPPVTAGGD